MPMGRLQVGVHSSLLCVCAHHLMLRVECSWGRDLQSVIMHNREKVGGEFCRCSSSMHFQISESQPPLYTQPGVPHTHPSLMPVVLGMLSTHTSLFPCIDVLLFFLGHGISTLFNCEHTRPNISVPSFKKWK